MLGLHRQCGKWGEGCGNVPKTTYTHRLVNTCSLLYNTYVVYTSYTHRTRSQDIVHTPVGQYMQQYCTHIVHMHRNHTGWSIHAAANVIVSWQCMASHTYYNMTYNLSVVQFMQPYFAIWLVSWRVSWSIHAVIHCHKTCPTQPVQSQNSQVTNYTRLQKRRQDLGNTIWLWLWLYGYGQ